MNTILPNSKPEERAAVLDGAMQAEAAQSQQCAVGHAARGAIESAVAPSEAMRAAAAQRLGCNPSELRFSEVGLQVPGAFFFSAGPRLGSPRVLINAAGEQLWRPSAYSPARHVREWLAGQRN